MGRFQLNLEKTSIQEAMEIKRKHQSIIIHDLESSLDVMLSHNLQYIEFLWHEDANLSTLVKALNHFPSLKVLYAQFTSFIDDLADSSDSMKTVSTKIEQLVCVVKIIHIFDCCTIKQLEIYCYSPIEHWNTLVIDFLKRQRNLEYLELTGEDCREFFSLPDIFEFNFPLKKFGYEKSVPFPYYEQLIKFLNQHKNTLTSLDVNFSTEPPFGIEFIHKFALENIVNLKHLEIGYLGSDEGQISFSELSPDIQATKLESLVMKSRSTDMNENRRFFDIMPNLKYLNLDSTFNHDNDAEILYCISERCPKLETLKVYVLYIVDFDHESIYFPNLKELIVEVECEPDLCIFINRHSQTLEKIILLLTVLRQ